MKIEDIKIGDYVRTTYGIGKIIKINPQYSDDHHLWQLVLITDKWHGDGYIEVGVFHRDYPYIALKTKNSGSNKIIDIEECGEKQEIFDYLSGNEEYVCYIRHSMESNSASLYDDHIFIEISSNLIDLIKVGDYVNGYKVSLQDDNNLWCAIDYNYNDKLKNIDIKSVVTREQMKEMEYNVNA